MVAYFKLRQKKTTMQNSTYSKSTGLALQSKHSAHGVLKKLTKLAVSSTFILNLRKILEALITVSFCKKIHTIQTAHLTSI